MSGNGLEQSRLQGSCLCGAVAFAIVPPAGFRWLAGAERVRRCESSPGKLRHFCGTCGSPPMAEHLGEPQVILRAALLDADPGGRPVERIFRRHEVPWCDPATPGIVSHPELPT